MKRYWILLFCISLACEGRLTDEQRKKMKEQMELHKIKRVTDAEITEAAYAKGREISSLLQVNQSDSTRLDSLVKAYQGKIRWIVPGQGNAEILEQQLIDAYLASEGSGVQDNVQELRNGSVKSDSILYSKPVVSRLPNGAEKLEGVWNIWLSRKDLILAMDKK
jgi:hypothetical protein